VQHCRWVLECTMRQEDVDGVVNNCANIGSSRSTVSWKRRPDRIKSSYTRRPLARSVYK